MSRSSSQAVKAILAAITVLIFLCACDPAQKSGGTETAKPGPETGGTMVDIEQATQSQNGTVPSQPDVPDSPGAVEAEPIGKPTPDTEIEIVVRFEDAAYNTAPDAELSFLEFNNSMRWDYREVAEFETFLGYDPETHPLTAEFDFGYGTVKVTPRVSDPQHTDGVPPHPVEYSFYGSFDVEFTDYDGNLMALFNVHDYGSFVIGETSLRNDAYITYRTLSSRRSRGGRFLVCPAVGEGKKQKAGDMLFSVEFDGSGNTRHQVIDDDDNRYKYMFADFKMIICSAEYQEQENQARPKKRKLD